MKFSIDKKGVVPGEYRMRIIAFEPNMLGRQTRHDYIPMALAFSIKDSEPDYNMAWNTKSWGHNKLPQAKTLEEEDL